MAAVDIKEEELVDKQMIKDRPHDKNDELTSSSSQAVELGDTGREVVLWVAMGLALWQLLMFAASIFLQGKIRWRRLGTSFFKAFSISH